MRATRALLRRRRHLLRTRAEWLPPSQHTTSPYTRPALGKKLADKAKRAGGAQRCPALAGHKRLEGDLALSDHDDRVLHDREWAMAQPAKRPDAHPLELLRTGPGLGKSLSLVLLYAMHDLTRFPRGPDGVASCRGGKWAKASAGQRYGTSGTKLGKASLPWAFAEAAGRLLRAKPAGQPSLARLGNTHGTGTALPLVAHKRARAVYDLLQRNPAFDPDTFFHGERSGRAGGLPGP